MADQLRIRARLDAVEPETRRVAPPLVVVGERPVKVAEHRDSLGDGGLHLRHVLYQHGLARPAVGPWHAVLGADAVLRNEDGYVRVAGVVLPERVEQAGGVDR